jgi:hypothetical protein
MFRVVTAVASLCLLLIIAGNGRATTSASPNNPKESAEDEAKERLERLAPKGGVREGELSTRPIELTVNGDKKAQFTGADLDKLTAITSFSPRGDKKSWVVVDVLKHYGITEGKTITFYNKRNKKISIPWDDLLNQQQPVVFTYNFKGELIATADVEERVPEEIRSTNPRDAKTEDERRKQMHKQRQRSLLFFRDVRRVDVAQ